MVPPARTTRQVLVGGVALGGGAPVSVQSMTKTDTRDVEATVRQIARLAEAGADLVRVAVPDQEAADAFGRIRRRSPVPLVADIHFDYRLALAAAQQGADKLRLNPGNIGGPDRVAAVVAQARERGLPIRIGVNAGSLEKDLLAEYGPHSPGALAESARRHVAALEALDFRDIVVSLKASEVATTVHANRLFAAQSDVPLHLGVTEAGLGEAAVIKSAVGIGALLLDGIGDTIRVSLTDDPVREVGVALALLRSLGLRPGPQLIACPTCARCHEDLLRIAAAVEAGLRDITATIVVAVMGCEVNGPGEAKSADVGVALGQGRGVIFRRGERVRTVPAGEVVDVLLAEVRNLTP